MREMEHSEQVASLHGQLRTAERRLNEKTTAVVADMQAELERQRTELGAQRDHLGQIERALQAKESEVGGRFFFFLFFFLAVAAPGTGYRVPHTHGLKGALH